MVCEEIIKQMEQRLKRKLTKEEKKKVEEKAHHAEIHDNEKDYSLECKDENKKAIEVYA